MSPFVAKIALSLGLPVAKWTLKRLGKRVDKLFLKHKQANETYADAKRIINKAENGKGAQGDGDND